MKCPICKHGKTEPGKTTVTLQRGATTLVLKDVPAEVCDNCGEAFVDEATTQRLLADAEKAATSGVEVEIQRYEAA